MDQRIQSFLESEKNLTLCTSVNNAPHCVSCFYAFLSTGNFLVFKSARNTKHIADAMLNSKVAGTIVPDIHKIGTVKGIQFTGRFVMPSHNVPEEAKKKYYLKFPFALIMPGELWAVELLSVKMIDNTLGFGKKLTWQKSPVEELNVW